MASETKEDGADTGKSELEANEVSNASIPNCALCGCSTPAVRCDKCNSQTFCLSCDDMYHRHPKRRLHLRKAVDSIWNSHRSPRLRRGTNLPGDPSKIPIPPPRRRKRERFNTFAGGSSFPKTPFDISAIARRDSLTAKFSGVNKQNAVLSNNIVRQSSQERIKTEPSYENSAAVDEQNTQIDPSVNGAPHELMEQMASNKLKQSVSNGNLRKSPSTEMDQFASIHMANALHVSVSPTSPMHDENQDVRNTENPAHLYSRGSRISHSDADLRSMPMSPHFFYPPPHPVVPHHIHPYSPSATHMNCPQCMSASWSNLMSPHVPPYHPQQQWNSASSTLSRKRHASGSEGQFKPNQTSPMDPSGYVGPHVPFMHPAYPYMGAPFYPHGYPAAESPLFMDSQSPVDLQGQAKSPSISSRLSPSTDQQGESDQMVALAQSGEDGEAERVEKEVEAEEESEIDENVDDDEDDPAIIVPEKPSEPWSCAHCTYINPPGSHICEVCCKTSYVAPQKEPQKKKKKREPKSNQKSMAVNALQSMDAATSSSVAAMDEPMQVDAEQHLTQDPEKLSVGNDFTEKGDKPVDSTSEGAPDLRKYENVTDSKAAADSNFKESDTTKNEELKESAAFEDASEIDTLSNFLTTETQTVTSTTSTDVQTQQLSCVSVASSTDSLFHLIKHEISVQTEAETLTTKQSVATDPMISSQSMESLLSGVSAPPYHNRRAGLGRSGNSFSTQSLSAFERGRSRSPIPRSSSMHGEIMSFGRGLNSISQDPIHCSWSRPFWGTDPMYYKPHGLRRLGHSDSREDDFDGTWGSVDKLNKDLKKKKEEKWRSDFTTKPRFHRSLTDLKHDKRPESPHMPEMEFLQIVRDAERFGYTVDDLQVAYLHCGKGDPVLWLEDNWNEMIKNVIALAAKYGQDNEENDVGAISPAEAKEALRVHRGDLWDAVTECIEIRQRKILELTVRGNFTQRQIVEALKNNDGNVELAYADLIRATSRSFKHILSPGLSEESEDIGCQRVPSETAPEPSTPSDVGSVSIHPDKLATGTAPKLTEDENAEKKRSDFLTKLSAIRQAQSERRKAREEKELSREVEKVFKETYLETNSQMYDELELKNKLPSLKAAENISDKLLPEIHQDTVSESIEIHPLASEVSIPQDIIDSPYQAIDMPDSTVETMEKVGDITPLPVEKDEDIPEDFDSHWIDSQGEWIEEFSDEQWEEEGDEGQGEWVTVRTKYRKLETDLDAEAKQLASLWENEELVDDVFEDDAKDSSHVEKSGRETSHILESSKQDNWEELNLSQQEENELKQYAETQGTLKEDYQGQFSVDEYTVKDSENNWITAHTVDTIDFPQKSETEVNEYDMQVKGDWVTLQSEEISDKDILSAGIINEEQLKLLQHATEEYEVKNKIELQDSLSEQYSEEDWEKVDPHEHYPDSLKDNVVVTTTDDEGQYLGKLSSEEDPDTVLTSSLENLARKRNVSFPTDIREYTMSEALDLEDLSTKESETTSKLPLPPKRQKVRLSSIENDSESRIDIQIKPQLPDVISQQVQQPEDLSFIDQDHKPPVPVRKRSKVNGVLVEQLKNKVEVSENTLEQKVNTLPSLPIEAADKPSTDSKAVIANDEFLQTSVDLEVSREGEDIFQSAISYNTVIMDTEKFGRQLVAGGSRYLATAEEVPMEFESINASPEPSLTYDSDSNCFADSESEFDNKENRKVCDAHEQNIEKNFVCMTEQMSFEKLDESEGILLPDDQSRQDLPKSSSQGPASFSLESSSLSYIQAPSEMSLEYANVQNDNLNKIELDQYEMPPASFETAEQLMSLSQYEESMQLVNALSQGYSDKEFQSVIVSNKESSLPAVGMEPQQLQSPVLAETSPILDESLSLLSHSEKFLHEQIDEEKVEDTEEIPALSEMEATSAAADYYFGRYNEITVTRKVKKKPSFSKGSKPTTTTSSSVARSSPIPIPGMTKSSPTLETPISPNSVSSLPNVGFSNAESEQIAIPSSVTLSPIAAASSEEMKAYAPQVVPEEAKKAAIPTEYLSFAEDYFFGSYNEVVVPKKGKKKMPAVKSFEVSGKAESVIAEPAPKPLIKEELKLSEMEEARSEAIDPEVLAVEPETLTVETETFTLVSDVLEVKTDAQLLPAHPHSIIPSHSKGAELEAEGPIDQKVLKKEVSVKPPSNIVSVSSEVATTNVVPRDNVGSQVEIKNKSVRFQDSEPPVVPPPRRKNQMLKQDSQPQQASTGSMYAAAEYLFGRYDEIIPSTKISTPKTASLAKKKLPPRTNELGAKPPCEPEIILSRTVITQSTDETSMPFNDPVLSSYFVCEKEKEFDEFVCDENLFSTQEENGRRKPVFNEAPFEMETSEPFQYLQNVEDVNFIVSNLPDSDLRKISNVEKFTSKYDEIGPESKPDVIFQGKDYAQDICIDSKETSVTDTLELKFNIHEGAESLLHSDQKYDANVDIGCSDSREYSVIDTVEENVGMVHIHESVSTNFEEDVAATEALLLTQEADAVNVDVSNTMVEYDGSFAHQTFMNANESIISRTDYEENESFLHYNLPAQVLDIADTTYECDDSLVDQELNDVTENANVSSDIDENVNETYDSIAENVNEPYDDIAENMNELSDDIAENANVEENENFLHYDQVLKEEYSDLPLDELPSQTTSFDESEGSISSCILKETSIIGCEFDTDVRYAEVDDPENPQSVCYNEDVEEGQISASEANLVIYDDESQIAVKFEGDVKELMEDEPLGSDKIILAEDSTLMMQDDNGNVLMIATTLDVDSVGVPEAILTREELCLLDSEESPIPEYTTVSFDSERTANVLTASYLVEDTRQVIYIEDNENLTNDFESEESNILLSNVDDKSALEGLEKHFDEVNEEDISYDANQQAVHVMPSINDEMIQEELEKSLGLSVEKISQVQLPVQSEKPRYEADENLVSKSVISSESISDSTLVSNEDLEESYSSAISRFYEEWIENAYPVHALVTSLSEDESEEDEDLSGSSVSSVNSEIHIISSNTLNNQPTEISDNSFGSVEDQEDSEEEAMWLEPLPLLEELEVDSVTDKRSLSIELIKTESVEVEEVFETNNEETMIMHEIKSDISDLNSQRITAKYMAPKSAKEIVIVAPKSIDGVDKSCQTEPDAFEDDEFFDTSDDGTEPQNLDEKVQEHLLQKIEVGIQCSITNGSSDSKVQHKYNTREERQMISEQKVSMDSVGLEVYSTFQSAVAENILSKEILEETLQIKKEPQEGLNSSLQSAGTKLLADLKSQLKESAISPVAQYEIVNELGLTSKTMAEIVSNVDENERGIRRDNSKDNTESESIDASTTEDNDYESLDEDSDSDIFIEPHSTDQTSQLYKGGTLSFPNLDEVDSDTGFSSGSDAGKTYAEIKADKLRLSQVIEQKEEKEHIISSIQVSESGSQLTSETGSYKVADATEEAVSSEIHKEISAEEKSTITDTVHAEFLEESSSVLRCNKQPALISGENENEGSIVNISAPEFGNETLLKQTIIQTTELQEGVIVIEHLEQDSSSFTTDDSCSYTKSPNIQKISQSESLMTHSCKTEQTTSLTKESLGTGKLTSAKEESLLEDRAITPTSIVRIPTVVDAVKFIEIDTQVATPPCEVTSDDSREYLSPSPTVEFFYSSLPRPNVADAPARIQKQPKSPSDKFLSEITRTQNIAGHLKDSEITESRTRGGISGISRNLTSSHSVESEEEWTEVRSHLDSSQADSDEKWLDVDSTIASEISELDSFYECDQDSSKYSTDLCSSASKDDLELRTDEDTSSYALETDSDECSTQSGSLENIFESIACDIDFHTESPSSCDMYQHEKVVEAIITSSDIENPQVWSKEGGTFSHEFVKPQEESSISVCRTIPPEPIVPIPVTCSEAEVLSECDPQKSSKNILEDDVVEINEEIVLENVEHEEDYADLSSHPLTTTEESDKWSDVESDHSIEDIECDNGPLLNQYSLEMGETPVASHTLTMTCTEGEISQSFECSEVESLQLNAVEATTAIISEVSLNMEDSSSTSASFSNGKKDLPQNLAKEPNLAAKMAKPVIQSSKYDDKGHHSDIKAITVSIKSGDHEDEYADISSHIMTTEDSDYWLDVESESSAQDLNEDKIFVSDSKELMDSIQGDICSESMFDSKGYSECSISEAKILESSVEQDLLGVETVSDDLKILKEDSEDPSNVDEKDHVYGAEDSSLFMISELDEYTDISSDHITAEDSSPFADVDSDHSTCDLDVDYIGILEEQDDHDAVEKDQDVKDAVLLNSNITDAGVSCYVGASSSDSVQDHLNVEASEGFVVDEQSVIDESHSPACSFMSLEASSERVKYEADVVTSPSLVESVSHSSLVSLESINQSSLISLSETSQTSDEAGNKIEEKRESSAILSEEYDEEYVDMSLHISKTEESDAWDDVESDRSVCDLEADETPLDLKKKEFPLENASDNVKDSVTAHTVNIPEESALTFPPVQSVEEPSESCMLESDLSLKSSELDVSLVAFQGNAHHLEDKYHEIACGGDLGMISEISIPENVYINEVPQISDTCTSLLGFGGDQENFVDVSSELLTADDSSMFADPESDHSMAELDEDILSSPMKFEIENVSFESGIECKLQFPKLDQSESIMYDSTTDSTNEMYFTTNVTESVEFSVENESCVPDLEICEDSPLTLHSDTTTVDVLGEYDTENDVQETPENVISTGYDTFLPSTEESTSTLPSIINQVASVAVIIAGSVFSAAKDIINFYGESSTTTTQYVSHDSVKESETVHLMDPIYSVLQESVKEQEDDLMKISDDKDYNIIPPNIDTAVTIAENTFAPVEEIVDFRGEIFMVGVQHACETSPLTEPIYSMVENSDPMVEEHKIKILKQSDDNVAKVPSSMGPAAVGERSFFESEEIVDFRGDIPVKWEQPVSGELFKENEMVHLSEAICPMLEKASFNDQEDHTKGTSDRASVTMPPDLHSSAIAESTFSAAEEIVDFHGGIQLKCMQHSSDHLVTESEISLPAQSSFSTLEKSLPLPGQEDLMVCSVDKASKTSSSGSPATNESVTVVERTSIRSEDIVDFRGVIPIEGEYHISGEFVKESEILHLTKPVYQMLQEQSSLVQEQVDSIKVSDEKAPKISLSSTIAEDTFTAAVETVDFHGEILMTGKEPTSDEFIKENEALPPIQSIYSTIEQPIHSIMEQEDTLKHSDDIAAKTLYGMSPFVDVPVTVVDRTCIGSGSIVDFHEGISIESDYVSDEFVKEDETVHLGDPIHTILEESVPLDMDQRGLVSSSTCLTQTITECTFSIAEDIVDFRGETPLKDKKYIYDDSVKESGILPPVQLMFSKLEGPISLVPEQEDQIRHSDDNIAETSSSISSAISVPSAVTEGTSIESDEGIIDFHGEIAIEGEHHFSQNQTLQAFTAIDSALVEQVLSVTEQEDDEKDKPLKKKALHTDFKDLPECNVRGEFQIGASPSVHFDEYQKDSESNIKAAVSDSKTLDEVSETHSEISSDKYDTVSANVSNIKHDSLITGEYDDDFTDVSSHFLRTEESDIWDDIESEHSVEELEEDEMSLPLKKIKQGNILCIDDGSEITKPLDIEEKQHKALVIDVIGDESIAASMEEIPIFDLATETSSRITDIPENKNDVVEELKDSETTVKQVGMTAVPGSVSKRETSEREEEYKGVPFDHMMTDNSDERIDGMSFDDFNSKFETPPIMQVFEDILPESSISDIEKSQFAVESEDIGSFIAGEIKDISENSGVIVNKLKESTYNLKSADVSLSYSVISLQPDSQQENVSGIQELEYSSSDVTPGDDYANMSSQLLTGEESDHSLQEIEVDKVEESIALESDGNLSFNAATDENAKSMFHSVSEETLMNLPLHDDVLSSAETSLVFKETQEDIEAIQTFEISDNSDAVFESENSLRTDSVCMTNSEIVGVTDLSSEQLTAEEPEISTDLESEHSFDDLEEDTPLKIEELRSEYDFSMLKLSSAVVESQEPDEVPFSAECTELEPSLNYSCTVGTERISESVDDVSIKAEETFEIKSELLVESGANRESSVRSAEVFQTESSMTTDSASIACSENMGYTDLSSELLTAEESDQSFDVVSEHSDDGVEGDAQPFEVEGKIQSESVSSKFVMLSLDEKHSESDQTSKAENAKFNVKIPSSGSNLSKPSSWELKCESEGKRMDDLEHIIDSMATVTVKIEEKVETKHMESTSNDVSFTDVAEYTQSCDDVDKKTLSVHDDHISCLEMGDDVLISVIQEERENTPTFRDLDSSDIVFETESSVTTESACVTCSDNVGVTELSSELLTAEESDQSFELESDLATDSLQEDIRLLEEKSKMKSESVASVSCQDEFEKFAKGKRTTESKSSDYDLTDECKEGGDVLNVTASITPGIMKTEKTDSEVIEEHITAETESYACESESLQHSINIGERTLPIYDDNEIPEGAETSQAFETSDIDMDFETESSVTTESVCMTCSENIDYADISSELLTAEESDENIELEFDHSADDLGDIKAFVVKLKTQSESNTSEFSLGEKQSKSEEFSAAEGVSFNIKMPPNTFECKETVSTEYQYRISEEKTDDLSDVTASISSTMRTREDTIEFKLADREEESTDSFQSCGVEESIGDVSKISSTSLFQDDDDGHTYSTNIEFSSNANMNNLSNVDASSYTVADYDEFVELQPEFLDDEEEAMDDELLHYEDNFEYVTDDGNEIVLSDGEIDGNEIVLSDGEIEGGDFDIKESYFIESPDGSEIEAELLFSYSDKYEEEEDEDIQRAIDMNLRHFESENNLEDSQMVTANDEEFYDDVHADKEGDIECDRWSDNEVPSLDEDSIEQWAELSSHEQQYLEDILEHEDECERADILEEVDDVLASEYELFTQDEASISMKATDELLSDQEQHIMKNGVKKEEISERDNITGATVKSFDESKDQSIMGDFECFTQSDKKAPNLEESMARFESSDETVSRMDGSNTDHSMHNYDVLLSREADFDIKEYNASSCATFHVSEISATSAAESSSEGFTVSETQNNFSFTLPKPIKPSDSSENIVSSAIAISSPHEEETVPALPPKMKNTEHSIHSPSAEQMEDTSTCDTSSGPPLPSKKSKLRLPFQESEGDLKNITDALKETKCNISRSSSSSDISSESEVPPEIPVKKSKLLASSRAEIQEASNTGEEAAYVFSQQSEKLESVSGREEISTVSTFHSIKTLHSEIEIDKKISQTETESSMISPYTTPLEPPPRRKSSTPSSRRSSLECRKPTPEDLERQARKMSFDKANIHGNLGKKRLSIEDRMQKLQLEGKCTVREKAFIAAKLMEMQFEEDDALLASRQCSDVYNAVKFLTQLCELCKCRFPINQMASMVHCPHRACKECFKAHFTSLISDRSVFALLCPICHKPDISDYNMQEYFNHLDIMLRNFLEPEIHSLFQQKLRDEVLTKDPNFHWCSQCSSGFIASPRLKKLYCPDCSAITCALCHETWELEHEGVHCERFQQWKDMHTPEPPPAGLVKKLADRGIVCPSCGIHYSHASGGCMLYRCEHCSFEFCAFCRRPNKRGKDCSVSDACKDLGIHAHHPYKCLYHLRDKHISELQELLESHSAPYITIPPPDQIVKSRCQVREQKYAHGKVSEDRCKRDIVPYCAGLCRVHYMEYLVELIRQHKINPLPIMTVQDLQFMLRKARWPVPEKVKGESNEEYKSRLTQVIEDTLS